MRLRFAVNGKQVEFEAEAKDLLLDVLRREGYHGVKRGCRKGDCGACAVLIDGRLFNSCIVPAMSVQGRSITTIEGIGTPNHPHVIQETFLELGAVQCGFCTPGMILAAKSLLDKVPDPDEEDIKKALDGNLCRCTGYLKIIDAVRTAAMKIREEQK